MSPVYLAVVSVLVFAIVHELAKDGLGVHPSRWQRAAAFVGSVVVVAFITWAYTS